MRTTQAARDAVRRWEKKNPEKVQEYACRTREKNRERIRTRDRARYWSGDQKLRKKGETLKRLYGLTLKQFNVILKEQEGRCAICGELQVLVVDHNHTTKVVRGLLCNRCNLLIGYAREQPEILLWAAEYLRTWQYQS